MFRRIFLLVTAFLAVMECTSVHAQSACSDNRIFVGGASVDSGASFSLQVSASDALFIGGELCPLPTHLGEIANVYVAFEIDAVIYLLNSDDELVIYASENPVAYRTNVVLENVIPINLFNGVVGEPIELVNLYVAYSLNGTFYLDENPVSFSINAVSALKTLSVFPEQASTTAANNGEISLSFDRALAVGAIDDTDIKVFGRWSGVLTGQVSLSDDQQTLRFTPERNLSAGEWVTVTVDDIVGTDGSRLASGYSWSFWVASVPAMMEFEQIDVISTRVPDATAQIQTYGAYAGDLNQDGWSDLVVPNELSNDLRIFLNDGAGGYDDFTIVPIEGAIKPSPNAGADFDGDGDIDFAVGSAWGTYVHIFLGDGTGALVQSQNLLVGERVRGVCLVDFENDGDPDIVATAYIGNHVSLFNNDGSGNFSAAGTIDAGDGEWSCASSDMNGDGLMDFIVGTRNSNELMVLLSNGDGTFTEATRILTDGDPWMLAAGDVDRDGAIDIVAVNANAISVTVSMGTGTGGLADPTSYSLAVEGHGFPLAVDLGDLDGDGDLDIVTSDFRTRLFLIHENQGDGKFIRLPNQLFAPEAASCAILHDRDNDGDLDITGIDEVQDVLILFRN